MQGRLDPNSPTSPGTGQAGKRKKIDVIGAQSDGAQLAAALPAAVAIPADAQEWAQVCHVPYCMWMALPAVVYSRVIPLCLTLRDS